MRVRAVLSMALSTALAVLSCAPGAPEEGLIAITGGLVYPVSSEPIPGGTVVIRDGKIEAVGADVSVPAGADVIDATGMSVIPGIVESHSHTGFKVLNIPATGANNNELSVPINAHVRAIDGLDSKDPAFALMLASGITTQNITTGSRSPNSGQAVLVKSRGGTVEDMYFAPAGIKMAIRATTPYPGFPETEQEVFDLLSGELEAAQEYLDALAAHEADSANPRPARNLTYEALGKLLTREWVLGVHSHSEQQMRYAMELMRQFNLDAYIHHGQATLELAEELHELGMPVSYGPILPGDSRESGELLGPVKLVELGGLVAFHQDPPDGHAYWLRHTGAMFVRQGMSHADALAALTLNGARIFHVDDRIGSLEAGKDADIAILGGEDPLAYESLVMRVFVDGVEVFNRATGYNVFGDVVPEGW
ncbi:MAG: amidohydrolase family protein [Acidobacteria bacterium]|nr:amidohydrolase family protein [Acidobacteriota bacterium]